MEMHSAAREMARSRASSDSCNADDTLGGHMIVVMLLRSPSARYIVSLMFVRIVGKCRLSTVSDAGLVGISPPSRLAKSSSILLWHSFSVAIKAR